MDSGELQEHWLHCVVSTLNMHESSCQSKKQVMAIMNWTTGELCGPWASCLFSPCPNCLFKFRQI